MGSTFRESHGRGEKSGGNDGDSDSCMERERVESRRTHRRTHGFRQWWIGIPENHNKQQQ